MSIKSSSPSASSSPHSSLLLLSATRERDTERKRKINGETTAQMQPPQPSLSMSPTVPTTCLFRFEIGDFARLSHPKGSYVETRSIQISNRSWHLKVYPRGHGRSRSDKVLVSCFLAVDGGDDKDKDSEESSSSSSSSLPSDFEFAFRIRNWRMVPRRCGLRSDVAYGFMGHTREKILQQGLDEDGTLVVDVAIKYWSQPPLPPPPPLQNTTVWYPNKKHKQKRNDNTNMGGQLFRSHEFTDISFLVEKTVVRAHKCVLAVRARPLLELAICSDENGCSNSSNNSSNNNNNNNNDNDNDSEPINIPNVEEGVFRAFLDYIYTSSEENLLHFLETHEDDKNNNILGAATAAESLLVVADKFGATDLKVVVESVLADKFLSADNCFHMLLLADAHWCALLKEEATKLYCSDPMASIRGSNNGWKLLQESPKLLSELLFRSAQQQVAKSNNIINNSTNNNNNRFLQDLSIGALRDRLEEAGLDPDGSKEILIRRVASLQGPPASPPLALARSSILFSTPH